MYKDNNVVLDCFLCRTPKHYKLAMHVFGLLACHSMLKEMDEVVCRSAVLAVEQMYKNTTTFAHAAKREL